MATGGGGRGETVIVLVVYQTVSPPDGSKPLAMQRVLLKKNKIRGSQNKPEDMNVENGPVESREDERSRGGRRGQEPWKSTTHSIPV